MARVGFVLPKTLVHHKGMLQETREREEKRREYDRRVIDVEHGTIIPLVLSTSEGWGPSPTVAFRRLAGLIASKHNQAYSTTLQFIRCNIFLSHPLSIDVPTWATIFLPRPCEWEQPHRSPMDLIRREVQLGDYISHRYRYTVQLYILLSQPDWSDLLTCIIFLS